MIRPMQVLVVGHVDDLLDLLTKLGLDVLLVSTAAIAADG
jgi:hypothetical protein